MKTFKQYYEESLLENTFKPIKVFAREFNFTKTKSNKAWTERIASRTGLSENEFFKIISIGMENAFERYGDLRQYENVCLRFVKSKFVLVFNPNKYLIITVRDADWNNLDNGKCENSLYVFEDFKTNDDLKELIETTDYTNDGYEIIFHYEGDNLLLEYKDKCDFCIKLDL